MNTVNASDPRFFGATDSETIQNAVNYASENDLGRVTIPRFNERTGKTVWDIEKAIILPGHMTVVLEDAHLRLADGVFDNVFRSANWMTPEGKTLEGELSDIRILGTGRALIDGGIHNGLVEQMHRDDPVKYPRLSVNLFIFLVNVRDFEISGIQFIESRWWSICCIYCRFGRIANLDFKMYGTSENQDGIDLRVGCEHILIENITGITGDDTVALTALPNDDLVPETALHVEGKRPDIHDVIIRNVMSSSHGCYLLRLLCEDGAKIYNVLADGLYDTGRSISGGIVSIGISSTYFVKDHARRMGDFTNITLRNLSTNAQQAIRLSEPCQDLLIENLTVWGQAESCFRIFGNYTSENVVIRNVKIRADKETFRAVAVSDAEAPGAMNGTTIENVQVDYALHVHQGKVTFPIKDLTIAHLSGSPIVTEPWTVASAYGRYHRCAFGKEITNRPKDNRFVNEKKDQK